MATLGVTKKIGSKPAPKAGARVEIAEKSASNASGANPQISPLTPKSFANLPPLAGVRLATGQAGIKYRDRADVLAFQIQRPAAPCLVPTEGDGQLFGRRIGTTQPAEIDDVPRVGMLGVGQRSTTHRVLLTR